MKVITLESLPDETPETNENFLVVISNAQTTGNTALPSDTSDYDPMNLVSTLVEVTIQNMLHVAFDV